MTVHHQLFDVTHLLQEMEDKLTIDLPATMQHEFIITTHPRSPICKHCTAGDGRSSDVSTTFGSQRTLERVCRDCYKKEQLGVLPHKIDVIFGFGISPHYIENPLCCSMCGTQIDIWGWDYDYPEEVDQNTSRDGSPRENVPCQSFRWRWTTAQSNPPSFGDCPIATFHVKTILLDTLTTLPREVVGLILQFLIVSRNLLAHTFSHLGKFYAVLADESGSWRYANLEREFIEHFFKGDKIVVYEQ